MALFLTGLLLFLAVHSVRLVSEAWRQRQIQRIGAGPYKLVIAVLSLVSFVMLCWGYGQARLAPVVIWSPPLALLHANALFTLVAFVFLAAAYVPRNALKARFGHPMLLAIKIWAVGHLLCNGTLDAMILFGAFLIWAVLDFISNRRRDRALGTVYAAASARGTALTIAAGVIGWAVFAFVLHKLLIGVDPFA